MPSTTNFPIIVYFFLLSSLLKDAFSADVYITNNRKIFYIPDGSAERPFGDLISAFSADFSNFLENGSSTLNFRLLSQSYTVLPTDVEGVPTNEKALIAGVLDLFGASASSSSSSSFFQNLTDINIKPSVCFINSELTCEASQRVKIFLKTSAFRFMIRGAVTFEGIEFYGNDLHLASSPGFDENLACFQSADTPCCSEEALKGTFSQDCSLNSKIVLRDPGRFSRY